MRKLWGVIKWIVQHLVVKSVNLNEGDPDAPPKPGVVVGIGGKF